MNGMVVPLGRRAFAIMQTLVEASGATVAKSDLMTRVWPDKSMPISRYETLIS